MLRQALFAEFIGTFILVFAGTGAIVVDSLTGSVGHIGIGMTFGAVVAALIYTLGHTSGAHFNPIVTFGFWLIGEFPSKKVVLYIIAQSIGAILASSMLLVLFYDAAANTAMLKNLGATLPRYSWWNAWIMEAILSFILMLVICGSAIHGKAVKNFAGLAIGLTVGLEALFAGPITGASMNPARSLAPALLSMQFDYLWIYLSAPFAGSLAASLSYQFFISTKEK